VLEGEAVEVAEIVKRDLFQVHTLYTEALVDETGDVLWYLNLLAIADVTSLVEVGARNLRELWRRYPGGFSARLSSERAA